MLLSKDNIKTLAAFLLHPVHLLKDHSRLVRSKIVGGKGNSISLRDCWITKTDIVFQGHRNAIEFNEAALLNCSIIVQGSNHHIVLDREVQLSNVVIKVFGSDNVIHIGARSSLGGGLIVHGGKGIEIQIGEGCVLAEGLEIWSTDTHSLYKEGEERNCSNPPRSIRIENHVWLGKDVAVMKGVTIRHDAVVGIRSVVTKDVDSCSLYVGSPCRKVRDNIRWNLTSPNNERKD